MIVDRIIIFVSSSLTVVAIEILFLKLLTFISREYGNEISSSEGSLRN